MKPKDIIEDIIMNNRKLNAVDMVAIALPDLLVHNYNTPFNKYLYLAGYYNPDGSIALGLDTRIYKYRLKILEDLCIYKVEAYIKSGRALIYDYSLEKVYILRAIIHNNLNRGLTGKENIDVRKIEKLLQDNYERFISGMSKGESDYKTLVRNCDWLKYTV